MVTPAGDEDTRRVEPLPIVVQMPPTAAATSDVKSKEVTSTQTRSGGGWM